MTRTETLEWIGHIENATIDYQDSWLETEDRPRPCICWKDGATLGFGWASHLSGDPGGFRSLGFGKPLETASGYDEFYRLPRRFRNKFLKEANKLFIEVLGKDILVAARRAYGTAKDYGTFGIKGRVKYYNEEEIDKRWDDLNKELEELASNYKRYKETDNITKTCRDCHEEFRAAKNGIKTTICEKCSHKRIEIQNKKALGF